MLISCKFGADFLTWSPILNVGVAELLMIVRVCSLYGHSKYTIWSLGGIFILALSATAVFQVLFMRTYIIVLYYEFLPGCYGVMTSTSEQWHVWIPALAFEGILMLLTIYKVISSYYNQMNRTITVLARDSMVYFVIAFVGLALTVANSIHAIVVFSILLPIQCIISIAVGRMMMNIRGLNLDDSEHTVHLRTLEFTHHHNSGSEPEEEA
ncbi:hypothetical protein PILCRDRAFT_827079 [Piloderma croceum F 1598]|uniref:Uncharacterized protein n=1 Tax=Piloderma croceum (strain F 1598) TaxID=765440 RepID=A0A0C3ET00_PILCF|nr:hypothetical protein PILCRDRAFT_827079 [Piloderma croceum F 1598]